MKIKMIRESYGSYGEGVTLYKKGVEYDVADSLAADFIKDRKAFNNEDEEPMPNSDFGLQLIECFNPAKGDAMANLKKLLKPKKGGV